MGVFTRPDSQYYWLYLETSRQKERTEVVIGTTTQMRRDSRPLADLVYHRRMNEIAARVHRLPASLEAARFKAYAAVYKTDVIPTHKGTDRELDILKHPVAFFGEDLLTKIDQDRVREYFRVRLATPIRRTTRTVAASTINREIDLLKAMLRDAVPKYLDASPLANMKRLHSVAKKKRLLQPDEERRLLKVATDPQDRALIILGLDTLVRLGDLLDLQRSDRDGVWLHIPDPKSGVPYPVPMSKRAVRALDAVDHDRPYYFEKFRRAVKERDWRGAVKKRLQWLCAAADPPVPFGTFANGITFHGATRKTGATRQLIKKKTALPVVQDLGGWKSPEMLLRIYAEAQKPDLLAAVGQSREAKKPTRSFPLPSRAKAKRA